MKKFALLLLVLLTATLGGCTSCGSCDGCPTLVETGQERTRRIALDRTIDLKEAVEDWDYFWLQERNSRLTQWHPYVGW